MVIMSLIAFGALLTMLHKTVNNIDRDPALANLTVDGTAKFVQIKNLGDEKDLKSGLYIIKDMKLEGPQENLFDKEIFLLNESEVRQTLGGFMLSEQKYYRKITVSYPVSSEKMLVEIETQNASGESYYQSITLDK
ncbi:hypothetical protein C0416_01420 [bacterium]|nr:hypothetical protein [bacterium]